MAAELEVGYYVLGRLSITRPVPAEQNEIFKCGCPGLAVFSTYGSSLLCYTTLPLQVSIVSFEGSEPHNTKNHLEWHPRLHEVVGAER